MLKKAIELDFWTSSTLPTSNKQFYITIKIIKNFSNGESVFFDLNISCYCVSSYLSQLVSHHFLFSLSSSCFCVCLGKGLHHLWFSFFPNIKSSVPPFLCQYDPAYSSYLLNVFSNLLGWICQAWYGKCRYIS